MEECGHSEQFRGLVAVRVVARYHQSLKNHNQGVIRIYRSRKEPKEQVRAEGGKPDKSNWFKKGGATNIFKVPATSGSELVKEAKAALDRAFAPSGLVIKVTEEPGPSISQCIVKSNNFPRQSCGRPLCPWQGKGEKCREMC